jgi:DNA-binding NarL/FixJ family response regulator
MSSYRIMLADPQSLIRKGLITIIEEVDGYRVIGEADRSTTLLRLADELKPDLIVFDLNLPYIGGISAFIECKRVWHGGRGLILAEQMDIPPFSLPSGIYGYLSKDKADIEIIPAIKTIERGNKYISPSLADGFNDLFAIREKRNEIPFTADILSLREKQILGMIAAGMFNREIADQLHISVRTVEHHRENIIRKLGVKRRADLIRLAIKLGYVA